MVRVADPTQAAASASKSEARRAAVDALRGLLGYNIRRAQVAVFRDFQQSVGEGQIRPVSFSVLMLADAQPGIAQVDLARPLALDKASTVAVIDRLERAGLIERRESADDRRRRGLFLTPAGQQRLRELKPEVEQHEARMRSRLTPDEASQLLRLLQRLYE